MSGIIYPGVYCAGNKKILDELRLIEPHLYSIAVNGKFLNSLEDLHHNDIFNLNFKLLGGKGGFGSLLKSFRITKSTNQNMCRDLTGRRLADVKEEERLRKWIANKDKRDKAEQRKNEEKLNKLRSGHKVKYHFKDKKYMRQRDILLEQTEDAIEAGMAAAEKSSSPESGISESSKSPSPVEVEESDDSDIDLETAAINLKTRKRKTIPVEAPVIKVKKIKTQEAIVQNEATGNKPMAVKVTVEEDVIVKAESSKKVEEEKVQKVFDPIDIDKAVDVKELEAYGLDHLKHELERRGLKYGGSLNERAKRLFSIKGLTPDKYPKKLLASKK